MRVFFLMLMMGVGENIYYHCLLTVLHLISIMKVKTFIWTELIWRPERHGGMKDERGRETKTLTQRERELRNLFPCILFDHGWQGILNDDEVCVCVRACVCVCVCVC